MSPTDLILESGATCASILTTARSGLLIDGRDYFRAVYDACRQAERSILMLGWQFDSRTPLVLGDDAVGATHPVGLLDFLGALCDERPELDVRLLAWSSSALFALEREPLQRLTFGLRSHKNLRFELDDCHPTGASQHQKVVIVDRSIAMVGGMDLCTSRWDDRAHLAADPRRKRPWPGRGLREPYHDVQAYVTGAAVDLLRDWFVERWERGTHERFVLADAPRRELAIQPSVEVTVPRIGLMRTLPELEEPPCDRVQELRALHRRAIAAATSLIYLENQYFSSEDIRRSLVDRMRRGGPAIEIVIVLPRASAGLKEQVSIGVRQAEILRQLKAVSWQTGHHVGVYYAAAPGPEGDEPVFIHSKVLAVDDRFLLVSSANTTNRSMGLDTELGLAWEADAPDPSLRTARLELLGEHCGLAPEAAGELLGPAPGLVSRLDQLARAGRHRLRMHAMCEDDEPGKSIAHALREDVELDPCQPLFEDILPEPGRWGGHLRDRLVNVGRRLRVAFGGSARSGAR